ncbi:hypothetical protein QL285_011946 [Trifolium repens]|nr:hypothetical protein QL285_011946 [Trifolium repens]
MIRSGASQHPTPRMPLVYTTVVKIASQLAKSDELTFSPCLGELTSVQTLQQRGSLQDRRSASQNHENAVRSDLDMREETNTRFDSGPGQNS